MYNVNPELKTMNGKKTFGTIDLSKCWISVNEEEDEAISFTRVKVIHDVNEFEQGAYNLWFTATSGEQYNSKGFNTLKQNGTIVSLLNSQGRDSCTLCLAGIEDINLPAPNTTFPLSCTQSLENIINSVFFGEATTPILGINSKTDGIPLPIEPINSRIAFNYQDVNVCTLSDASKSLHKVREAIKDMSHRREEVKQIQYKLDITLDLVDVMEHNPSLELVGGRVIMEEEF